MDEISGALLAMAEFDAGDPKRIQHFVKVHSFARLIGLGEGLEETVQRRLELAAVVHDIGIHPAEERYGRCDGKLQEQEGPDPARELLAGLGIGEDTVRRVCFLVGHHHTYEGVDGPDWQILLEADCLVNCYEDGLPRNAIRSAYDKVFRTETGRSLCRAMFAL